MGQSWSTTATRLGATMKGSASEATRCCGTSADAGAADFFHPTVSPVPRAVAGGHTHDGSPDHHPYLPSGASLRPKSGVLLSPGVVAATLVGMEAGSQVAALSADFYGPAGTWVVGRGGYGRRTPRPPRLRQGTPSRWRALAPPLDGVSVGAQRGRVGGAGHVPRCSPALGAPLHRRGGERLWDQRDRTVVPPIRASPHGGEPVGGRCRLRRPTAPAYASPHGTSAGARPATRVPPSGRGAHSPAHPPDRRRVGRKDPRPGGHHGSRPLVPPRRGPRGGSRGAWS
jgi:hypothetical protein